MNYSIWEIETLYKKPDFVIIGGGFTGLWTALSVSQKYPKADILIIEKHHYPLGASTRNAGFSCFGSITEILSDAKTMGWDKTLNIISKRFHSLRKIQREIEPDLIDYDNCGGYELLNTEVAHAELVQVNEKLKSITHVDKTFTFDANAQERFQFADFNLLPKSCNMVFNPLEGSLHPGKLVEVLIQKCYASGIKFLWNQEVTQIKSMGNAVQIKTKNHTFSSAKAIVCTNGFARQLFPELDVQPARGQVLLTSPISDLTLKGVFHSDEGFIYFRNVGNRVLLGGMRNLDFQTEKSYNFQENQKITEGLTSYLENVILPNTSFEITHRWTGIMAMGNEKTYLLEKYENIIYAVRLSGMGVALAPEIANEVMDYLN